MTQPRTLELDSPPPAGAAPTGTAHAASNDDHRGTRGRRLRAAILTSILARPLSVVISVVSLPLFIKYLGGERYGLYESVAALAVWLAMTNAGLSLGLQNRLQDCYVSGDRALARRYVSSLSVALLALALLGVVALTVAVPLIDWQRVFPTSTPEAGRGTALAVWVAGVLTLAGVALGVPHVAYVAYQETHVLNLWDGAAKLATLGACVAVVWTRWGLVGVILASSGTAVLVRAVNAVWFFLAEKPWLRPSPRCFDRNLLRLTIHEGVFLFILQAATALIFSTDKLIIGNRLNAGSVTAYAVVGKIFLIGYGMLMLVQMPLWPAYGDAIRRGDIPWARRALRRMIAATTGSMLLLGLLLFVFGARIVALVAPGQNIHVSRGLIVAVCAFFITRTWAESQSIPLNAAGIVRPQLVFLMGNGLLNVVLAFVLARPFGVLGVAWAFPITALFTTIWGYPWLIRRYLFTDRRPEAAAA
jgi:O-antigen/teichoic acid export membrane protein